MVLHLIVEQESLGTDYVPNPSCVGRSQRYGGELGDLGICELHRGGCLPISVFQLGHLLQPCVDCTVNLTGYGE